MVPSFSRTKSVLPNAQLSKLLCMVGCAGMTWFASLVIGACRQARAVQAQFKAGRRRCFVTRDACARFPRVGLGNWSCSAKFSRYPYSERALHNSKPDSHDFQFFCRYKLGLRPGHGDDDVKSILLIISMSSSTIAGSSDIPRHLDINMRQSVMAEGRASAMFELETCHSTVCSTRPVA